MVDTEKAAGPLQLWSQPQQAFWERWRAAMAGNAPAMLQPAGVWALVLEFWKAAIYGGLESQLAAAEIGKEWICTHDANSPEITLGTCQALHFAEDWTRAQMQIWNGWFAALEGLEPGVAPRSETTRTSSRSHEHARRHHTPPAADIRNGTSA